MNKFYEAITTQNVPLLQEFILDTEIKFQLDFPEEFFSDEDFEYELEMLPLMKAVELGNLEIIKILLQGGDSLPNWQISLGSALELAIQLGKAKIVEMLLQAGANFNQAGSVPPLITAVEYQHIDIVKILIEAGADINCVDESAITPLIMAVLVKNIYLVNFLLEKGANVDGANLDDYHCCFRSQMNGKFLSEGTPLIYAAREGNLQIVKLLVEAGANVNIISLEHGNISALNMSIQEGHREVCDYLLPLTFDPK